MIETVGKGGGAEQLIAKLVPAMRRRGANVELLALSDWPENHEDQLERDGVPLHRFHLSSPRSFAAALPQLKSLVQRGNYDIFWGHLYFGNLQARLAQWLAGRGSLAITLHSRPITASDRRLSGRVYALAERKLLACAEAKVAVSKALRDDYIKRVGWRDIDVIHNGVDCNELAFEAAAFPNARKQFGFHADDFLLVLPGRYIHLKGHRFLIEALEKLRDKHSFRPKLLCCGLGGLQHSIRSEVDRRGLASQIRIEDTIAHDRLLGLVAAADAVVIPSLYESFGIAAAEAMALGTPCVLTKVDGFLELTEGCDCAHMVLPGDADAIADAILRLRDHPDQAAAMAARAKRHVRESFGIETCARRWIEVLESLPAATPRG